MISICIPAYRGEKFLAETIASVGAQTFRDWELIVTEDGSRDRTEEIVRAFAATVPQRVVYLRHDINKGLPAARNTGISAARGQWIAFLDADDLWLPNHLESLYQVANEVNPDAAFSSYISFNSETGEKMGDGSISAEQLADLNFQIYDGRATILPSAALFRRDVFAKFGLISPAYPICNDTEFWLRILSRGATLGYSGQNTLRYRKHPDSISKKQVSVLLELGRLYKEYQGWEIATASYRRRKPAKLYRYAGRQCLQSNPGAAAGMFWKSVCQAPTEASSWYFLGRALTARILGGSTREGSVKEAAKTPVADDSVSHAPRRLKTAA